MNMFAPQTQQRAPRREAERLKTLAESLQQGGQYKGNEVVSGMVVKQSPLEHLARGLQTAAGGYFAGQAQNKTDEDERALQQRMAEALGQWGNPQEAAAILAQDPRTSEMAFKLMMGETDFARQKELAQMRIGAMGRNSSGAIETLANRIMQEHPNTDFMTALSIAQKGIGQGMTVLPDGSIGIIGDRPYGDYSEPLNTGIPYPSQAYMPEIPPVNMMPNGEMQAPMGGQTPSIPLNPMQNQEAMQGQQFNDLIGGLTGQPMQQAPVQNESVLRVNPPNMPLMPNQYTTMGQQPGQPPQDPVAAHAQAVAMQQQQTGVSPMQRPELRPQVGNYADISAGIAAQKKGAEERAKMLNSPMDASIVKEQNELVDKINTARGLESSMNKFIGQIDSGQLDLSLMANLENMARNNLTMSTEQSRNLGSFKANLERLRNESLRINTGVQTDGDSQRAWSELVANINDPQFVRQRLTEIAEINKIGAQLQNQKLNLMRSEYGRGELDIPNPYQQAAPQAPTQDINAEIEALERELGIR